MKVAFAGTPEFAAAALEAILAAGFDVPLVLTQPDRPAGRGMQLQPSPVKRVALAAGIPVHQPEKLRTPEQQAPLAAVQADVLVVAAYGIILPQAQVFKTLLAHHDKQAVVAIVPSSGMCSLKQLAKATGLKKVEMMKPADAEKLTGYKVGGISPLAQKKLLPTVLDDSAMAFDEILVSGGKRGLSVGVAPEDMVRLMKWIAAPIGEHHE